MTAESIVNARIKIEESVCFESRGVMFTVRRVSRTDYSLGSSKDVRRRYGLIEEIRADVKHALEFGSLPARIDHAF